MENQPLNDIEDTLEATARVGKNNLDKQLKVTIFRWIIILVLYAILWGRYDWLKWTLLLLIPAAIINLWHILSLRKKFTTSIQDVQESINEIEELSDQ